MLGPKVIGEAAHQQQQVMIVRQANVLGPKVLASTDEEYAEMVARRDRGEPIVGAPPASPLTPSAKPAAAAAPTEPPPGGPAATGTPPTSVAFSVKQIEDTLKKNPILAAEVLAAEEVRAEGPRRSALRLIATAANKTGAVDVGARAIALLEVPQ